MKVNVHCHFTTLGEDFSYEMAEHYVKSYAAKKLLCWWTGKPWREEDFCVSVDKLVQDMDRAEVDKVCIMGYVMMSWNSYKPDLVEYIASAIEKYPNRLLGFVTVDPLGNLKAVEEIERAATLFGFRGVKLLPAYNCVAPNDRRIWPIYEKAQEMNLPVLVHTGQASFPAGKTLEYTNPLLLEDVALDFPDLRIIAAHVGGLWSNEALTLLRRFENTYTDLAYWIHEPFFRLVQILVWAKKIGVLSRVLWGSDYPECDFAPEIEMYRRVPDYTTRHELEPFITQEDIDWILGENAGKLLGLT
jgi:predicted TIM-barrel fold metal-dependent hydrolase